MAQEINLEEFIISCQAKKERKSLDAEIDNYEELSGERSFLEVSSAEALNDTDDTLCVYDSNNWAFDVESTRATFYIGNSGEIINKKTGTTPRSASFASLNLSEESSSLQFNLPPPSVENAYKKRKFVDFRELTCEDVRRGFTKSGNCDEGYNIKLSVANRGLKDLRSVSNFTNLTEIDVSGNYLKCVRALGVMQYLENLNASSNDIETFLDICPIPLGLKEVDFSKNCISKILNLKPFWTLTDINLSYNSLTEMEIEDPMYYLKSLDLSHNMITKINLNCPNLFILNLKSNCLNAIEGLEHCSNLCSLNLARNQISELGSLKYFGSLVELHIERNNIADLYELETLKALLYLHCLWVHHNKISFLEYSRLMFIHTLPQLLSLDGKKITIQEMRDAKNIFNPSSIKLSCLDHTNTLVDRACQPSNVMYETFCQCTSSAPIILIVGTEQSECHKLALLLKEEFRTSVHLGGVHSTAATMEGSNRDIPITLEAFAEMKNRGDFLTTSHILGRICGFSSSQISRATERRAILVASVPLGTAISIRKWKIQSKIVLVLPSTPLIISHGEKERTLVEYQNIIEDEQELESEEEQNSEEEEEDSLEEDDFMEEQRDSIEGEDIADEKSEMVYDQLNSTEIDDIGEKLQVAYANMDTMELFGYDDDPMRYLEHRASTDESEDTSNKDKKTPEETKDSNEAHDFTEEQKDLDNDVAEEKSKNSSSEENDDEEEGECDDYSVESESEPSLESSSKDEIQIEEEVSDEKEEDECHEVFDLEYYKFKDKEALAESINKTRELYAEFHRENPDFFQEPLDTPDVCYSYALLLYELQTKLLLVLPPASNLPVCDENGKSTNEVEKSKDEQPVASDEGKESTEEDNPSNEDQKSIDEHQNDMVEHTESIDEERKSTDEHQNSPDEQENSTDEHRNSVDEQHISMDEHRNSMSKHQNSVDEHQNSADELENSDEHQKSTHHHQRPPCGHRKSSGGHRKSTGVHRKSTDGHQGSTEEERRWTDEEGTTTAEVRVVSEDEETSAEERKVSTEVNDAKNDQLEIVIEKSYLAIVDSVDDKLEKAYAKLDTTELDRHVDHDHKKHEQMKHRRSIDKEHNEQPIEGERRVSIEDNDDAEEELYIEDERMNSMEMDEDGEKVALRKKRSIQWTDKPDSDYDQLSLQSGSTVQIQNEEESQSNSHQRKENDACLEIHDIEYHQFKHKDALAESINKNTELYAEFHRENPGFFQQVLDTSDLCHSFGQLRELALECIEAYQGKLQAPLTERTETSYGGYNTLDEAVFHEHRMQHYRNCSIAWSKGLDTFTKSGQSNVQNTNECANIFWKNASGPKNILDATLPRPQLSKTRYNQPMKKGSPCANFKLK